jgi:hypothetical protein
VITATYRTADLKTGFSVQYRGTDGIEFVYDVTQNDAEDELLLVMPSAKKAAAAEALAAEPTPPARLDVSIDAAADAFNITAHNSGYTWKGCTAVLPGGTVALRDLRPDSPVVVPRSSFVPAVTDRTQTPIVRCHAKGALFEGPAPAELVVAIERVGLRSWTVRNLTNWGYYDCFARFGDRKATLLYFPPNGQRLLAGNDFIPIINTDNPGADEMEFTCLLNGQTAVATRR